MAERRPTLAVTFSDRVESRNLWFGAIEDAGFNWLMPDVSGSVEGGNNRQRNLIEASVGLLAVARELDSSNGRAYRLYAYSVIRDANEFGLPLFLTDEPAQLTAVGDESFVGRYLQPDMYTLIQGDDVRVIWEKLQQEQPN